MESALAFSVEGEFVVDLARRMLWDEDKELSRCIAVLSACLLGLPENEKERTSIEILEGRKKLIGVDKLSLADDGEKIRPLSGLIRKKEYLLKVAELEDDMRVRPYLYVDVGCPGTSMRYPRLEDLSCTIGEIIAWRWHGESPELSREGILSRRGWDFSNHPLQGGVFLLENPKLALEILGGRKRLREEVMDACTVYFRKLLAKWKESGLSYETMNPYQKAVYERNMQCDKLFPYRLSPSASNETSAQEDVQAESASGIPISSAFSVYDEVENDSFWDASKPIFLGDPIEGKNYDGLPDEIGEYRSQIGWIDPNGEFYACGFARHPFKAYAIIRANPVALDLFMSFLKDKAPQYDEENLFKKDKFSFSEDFLFDLGWVRMRVQFHRVVPSIALAKPLTQAQLQTASRVGEQFELDYDPADYATVYTNLF